MGPAEKNGIDYNSNQPQFSMLSSWLAAFNVCSPEYILNFTTFQSYFWIIGVVFSACEIQCVKVFKESFEYSQSTFWILRFSISISIEC